MTSDSVPPGPARAKRQALVLRIADCLLEAGVAEIPLRDLAARLGTSDRMLLYYFDDKADLIAASLQAISLRLADALAAEVVGPGAPGRLLEQLSALLLQPEVERAMRVWSDLSARGVRGEAPFAAVAAGSVAAWLDWLEARLEIADASERRRTAAAILAIVEGARQMETAAPGSTAGVATLLSRAFA